ncbi:MAG: hypothetical protein V1929_08950 [bacterium]
MKLRVNLLKDGEARYQGPVSLRFLARVGGGTIIASLLLVVAIAVQRQIMLSRNLKWSQAEWARIGPRYEEIKKKQALLANYKDLLEELQQWGYTNTHWNEMLLELQKNVPDSVQLNRLQVDGSWTFIKPPTPPQKAGSTEPRRELPAIPGRQIKLAIAGRVTGDLADEVVVRFTKNLEKARGFDALFDTMKLQRLFRDASDPTKTAARQFEIEGQSESRKLQ